MRRLSISLFAFLFLTVPALAQNDFPDPPPAPEGESYTAAEQEVVAVLEEFARMWEMRDMDTFDRIIANDPHIVIVGTDTAEYLKGFQAFREAREAQYAAFDNIDHFVKDRQVHLSKSGEVAWFTEQFDLFTVDASGEQIMLEDLRLSGVLEQRDGNWVIVQLHTSVPVAGQAAQY